MPAFDVQCPLMSLPGLFSTTVETIPGTPAWLWFDPDRQTYWRSKLENHQAEQKIGLVWAGQSTHANDHNRSMPITVLTELAGITDAVFVSLQKSSAAAVVDINHPVLDWTNEFGDFADTAALVANLDAVLTVDTAVAHLAASLGKPVFLLLPFNADFRWLQDRSDSPWYPSMRLYRQTTRGDWLGPLRRVVVDLQKSLGLTR